MRQTYSGTRGGSFFFLRQTEGSHSTRTRTRTAGTLESGTASSASSTTFTGDAGRAFGAAHDIYSSAPGASQVQISIARRARIRAARTPQARRAARQWIRGRGSAEVHALKKSREASVL